MLLRRPSLALWHLLLCLAACWLLVLGVVAAAGEQPESEQEQDRAIEELIVLTNADRTSNGLPALQVDERLARLAMERSEDMIQRSYFSHEIPPDGRYFYDLLAERGITHEGAGENLADNALRGRRGSAAAERELLNSPVHRALILSPDFDHLGIGIRGSHTDTGSRTVYTVLFARFGQPGAFSRPAPSPEERARMAPPAVSGIRLVRTASDLNGGQPLGLVDDLIERTLRRYLGL